jgi:hypothetical protein
MNRPRIFAGVALAISMMLLPSGIAQASAPGVTSVALPSGCTGGNTSGPTLLAAREQLIPGYSAGLSAASAAFQGQIYVGTTCANSASGLTSRQPAGAATPQLTAQAQNLNQQVSTAPTWSCPQTSNYASSADPNVYGCTGYIIKLTTHFGTTSDSYLMSAGLENNLSVQFPSGGGNWSNLSNSFHDNNGGSWTPNISTWNFQCGDSTCFYTSEYSMDANGDFPLLEPACFTVITLPLCIQRVENETVHIGLKGSESGDTYFGAADVCAFAEFQPYQNRTLNSGFCATP